MAFRIRLRHLVASTCLMACGAAASAQSNPLYEHRRSVAGGAVAKSFLEESLVVHADVGRATFGTPSSRLIDADVQSGDPLLIEIGSLSLSVHVAFRDELERGARYAAAARKSAPPYAGPTLVIDRENPTHPIVLETSIGGAVMQLGVEAGSPVRFRSANSAVTPTRRQE